jgi:hypothetical protein
MCLHIYICIRACPEAGRSDFSNKSCIFHVGSLMCGPRTYEKNSEKTRAHICKRLWSPGIDSEESISPAYGAWRASTTNRAIVPARQAGNRFLGSLKGLQILAQHFLLIDGIDFHSHSKNYHLPSHSLSQSFFLTCRSGQYT